MQRNTHVSQGFLFMKSRKTPSQWSRSAVLFRLFWITLVLVHVSPVLAVSRSFLAEPAGHSLLALLILLPLISFFVLKALDAPFLRIHSTSRGMIAFAIACSIAHHGALASSVDQVTKQVPAVILLAGTASLLLASPRRRRRLHAFLDTLRAALRKPALLRHLRLVHAPWYAVGSDGQDGYRGTAPRAPPIISA